MFGDYLMLWVKLLVFLGILAMILGSMCLFYIGGFILFNIGTIGVFAALSWTLVAWVLGFFGGYWAYCLMDTLVNMD